MPKDSLSLEETEDLDSLEAMLEESNVPIVGDSEGPETEPEELEKPAEPDTEVVEEEATGDYAKDKVVPVDVMVNERKKLQAQLAEQQRQIDELRAGAQPEPEPEDEPEPAIAAYSEDELSELEDEFGEDYAKRAVKERQMLLDQQATINRLESQQTELLADKNASKLAVVLAETPLLRDWYNGRDGAHSKEFEAAVKFAKAAEVAFPNKSEVEQNKWVVEQVKSELGIKSETPTASKKFVDTGPLDSITDVPGGEAVSKKSSELELLTAINAGTLTLDKLSEDQREKVEELLEAESEWG